MPTTYATSIECGYAAGIKTISDYTYPTTSMVDIWRLIAYSKIRFRIGQVPDDTDRNAAAIEISMVSRMIQSVQNRQTGFSIELTDEERIQLDNNFNTIPGSKWEPDKDSSISGSGYSGSGGTYSPGV
jgi:hypothetical protein